MEEKLQLLEDVLSYNDKNGVQGLQSAPDSSLNGTSAAAAAAKSEPQIEEERP